MRLSLGSMAFHVLIRKNVLIDAFLLTNELCYGIIVS